MRKGGKGGIVSTVTGWIISLVMVGVVLAGLQLSGVSSVEETLKLAREKAVEYSECIPAGTCGLASVIDSIPGDSTINLDLGTSSGTTAPPKGNSVSRETEGYKGPSQGEPYVTNAGLSEKDKSLESLGKVKVVKDDSKSVGYERKEWKHWSDVNGKSCWNTREEVLSRDAVPGTVKYVDKQKNSSNYDSACAIGASSKEDGKTVVTTVKSGEWIDPYSGDKFSDSSKLDIDHIIPLSKAARSGGQKWDAKQKEAFANDLENLLAVSAKENRSKGDKGPGDYMPSNKKYHCQYAKSYIYLANKYSLTINEDDYKALEKAIKSCKN